MEDKQLPTKDIKPVVTGSVRTKKKSLGAKFADTFLKDDISNVKAYIVTDVIIPGITRALHDCICGAADMIFYGSLRGSSKGAASRVSYRSMYDRGPSERRDAQSTRRDRAYAFDDICFETRSDAEEVFSAMEDILDQYSIVSVGDYLDLCGISGTSTDQKHGWTSLANAEIERDRAGQYYIRMPKAMPIAMMK